MSRKNHNPHPRKPNLTDRYDTDYVSLPEFPNLSRIVARPLKTIFINLDAKADSDDFHVAGSMDDRILRIISERI